MLESINKIMLAGLGALSMTRERAEKIFEEYVRRGEAAKADREGFVKEMLDTAEKTRVDVSKLIEKQVQQALAKLNLPTHEDLARVEQKLDDLLKR
jgi:poly(hydroxyalkanoate) granule-associated protein